MGGAIGPEKSSGSFGCGKGRRRGFQGGREESEHLGSCSTVLGGDLGCADGLASGGCAKSREFEIEE